MGETLIIAKMDGVREYAEEYPVELWRQDGRFVVRAYNEAGFNRTEVDLQDLLAWLRKQDVSLQCFEFPEPP